MDTNTTGPLTLDDPSTPVREAWWGVLVKMPDMKRSEWLTPKGGLNSLRIYAAFQTGDAGKARMTQIATEVAEQNPGAVAKVAKLSS